jgi:hypothetical protein
MNKINNKMVDVMVDLLARGDALHYPIRGKGVARTWRNQFPAAQYQARQAHAAEGLRLTSGTPSEKQEVRAALAAAGMVTLKRRHGSSDTGVCLTERGEAIARQAAGFGELVTPALVYLHRLDELRGSANGWDGTDGEAWVGECELAGVEYGGGPSAYAALAGVEKIVVPSIRHGLVRVTSDIDGRTWYSLAPGTDPASLEPTPTPADAPKPSPRWSKLYRETVAAEFERLAEAELPDKSEIGPIPASCSPPLRRFASAATTEV